MKRSATSEVGFATSNFYGFSCMILSPRFEQALLYACLLHSGQVRKGTQVPYLAHLLSVAGLALEYGADEDEAIAALLHDVVEDAGGKARAADVRHRFGDRVAEIVLGCTDADTYPKPPWQARKEGYIAGLAAANPSARFISCCDKLHNARSIVSDLRQQGESVWQKFAGGKEGSLWYYNTLYAEYRRLDVCPALVQELERTLAVMRELTAAP
jgi:GTP pyrophosphokinase